MAGVTAGVTDIAEAGEDTAGRTVVVAADAPGGGGGHETLVGRVRGTTDASPASQPASRRRSSTVTAM